MSYDFLHTINERATPAKFMLYKHAIQLHKLFNLHEPPQDWVALNFFNLCLVGKLVLQFQQTATTKLETTF